jgi:hypothetical protein
MRSHRSNYRRQANKERLRSKIRREVWYVGKVVGKAAWQWARTQPPVQRRLDRLESVVEEVKLNARGKLADFERDFWAWVEQLESEGYIEAPNRSGPSLATCYDRLGVNAYASDHEVRKAWRKKMMDCHPDRFAQDPMALQKAEIIACEVNEAYQMIQKSRGL